MNLLIDIKHPAQLNLFKYISKHLQEKGWKITICYLERGKLPRIIEKEYSAFDRIKVGSSKGTKWSIIWNGNVVRTLDFMKLIRKKKIHICIAASSAPLALACRLTGTPVIQFYDDPERKRINKINEMLSNRIFFPPIINAKGKVEIFDCLKEWSYLSPKYFEPDIAVLKKYGFKGKDYVFVREVSNKSFNYYNQKDALVCSISGKLDDRIPVLLSLEDKSIREQFPPHWTILEEPIEDIHSLIYYAKLMVSSGDSMAREGSMLGVPSIYCGIREMKANELLIEKGLLEHYPAEKAIEPINTYIKSDVNPKKQNETRNKLLNDWIDMNSFMEQQILKYIK